MNIDFGVTLDDVGVRQLDKAYINLCTYIFIRSSDTTIYRHLPFFVAAGSGWLARYGLAVWPDSGRQYVHFIFLLSPPFLLLFLR